MFQSELANQEEIQLVESSLGERKKLPRIQMNDGGWYEGEWLNRMRDGYGVLNWKNGNIYEGYWKFNKAEAYAHGDIYEGTWSNAQFNGFGSYKQSGGVTYKGEFLNDLQHGKGVEIWPDGKYEGFYKNGKKCGKGKLCFADNSFYEGDLVDNQLQGQGKYTWFDGKIYEGGWLNNKMNGYGQTTCPNGVSYKGNYFNDKKHGYGVYICDNGKQYDGEWYEDMQIQINDLIILDSI